MNILAKHIELLLLEYDCVILPNFGGFIANHISACYSPEEHKILPPARSVAFNQDLTINDGLLVQTYMQAYDASYPEAKRQMEKDITQLCKELDMRGTCELGGIGTLSKDGRGNLSFVSVDSGLLTLDYYGYDTCNTFTLNEYERQMNLKRQMSSVSVVPIIIDTEEKQYVCSNDKNENIISKTDFQKETEHPQKSKRKIPTTLQDIVISTAAAVVLFFMFAYPALVDQRVITDANSYTEASVIPAKSKKPSIESQEHQQETVEQSKQTTDCISVDSDNPVPKSHFTIVLASYVTEKNANVFVNNMAAQGLSDCRYIKHGKVARIILGKYNSKDEATEYLRKMRMKHDEFKEAWVMSM